MSIFSKHWWHHHIKQWKAVGDIFGVTHKVHKAEDDALTALKNANKDLAGDPRYSGGYKDSTTGETIGDAVGQSIAHSEGDEE